MKHFFAFFIAIVNLFYTQSGYCQSQPALRASRPWNSDWIAAPFDPGNGYGVYYFRKSIELASKPTSFIIYVSADNRYKLYVNDTLVSLGPARGDTYFWNYETTR